MKKVAVIILNWNGKKLLEEFLPSVVKFTNTELADIIIADNGSKDDSIEFLKHKYPEIKQIIFKENYGFAEGYNKAINSVENEYIVLLNSDVEVTPNWLDELVKMSDSDHEIAAIQPKILSYKDKSKF